MLKRKTRKNRKPATPAASRKKIKTKTAGKMSPKEVVALERAAARHQDSERAWLNMTAAAPEEEDRWSRVEENLLAKTQERNHSERRWKYFAK